MGWETLRYNSYQTIKYPLMKKGEAVLQSYVSGFVEKICVYLPS